MSTIYKPLDYKVHPEKFSIFLAGTIDMGSSENWQKKITDVLADYDVDIYNPRRDDWDASWEQSASSEQFRKQVCWEQQALRDARLRIFVILGNSKSPITLLELGQFINKPGIVCCEPDFYRRGNVEIVCNLAGMTLVNLVDELVTYLQVLLDTYTIKHEGTKQ